MACEVCRKKPYFNGMCRQCFNNYFIKKTRREVRLNDLFRRNDSVFVENNRDAESFAAKWFIENMQMPLKISAKGKKIIGTCIEKESSEFFESMLKNKNLKKEKNTIKLLANMLQDEVYAFAKLKGYKGKLGKKNNINEMIERVEKKHSTTKFAFFKSTELLRKL